MNSNVKKSIQYQDGSIVSKVVIENKSGNITVFSFDKGQGLSKHSAPFDAVVYILEGEAEITIDETKYYVKEEEMIIMPANISHSVFASKQFKMILTMIKSS